MRENISKITKKNWKLKNNNPGNMNGRPKGSRNKIPANILEAFHETFFNLGVEGFTEWAKRHQSDFYKLYSKLLPSKVDLDIRPEEPPIMIHIVPAEFVPAKLRKNQNIEEKQGSNLGDKENPFIA